MNIFKRKQVESSYADVITKIHNEFDTAGEKLYKEAMDIINAIPVVNEDKAKRLKGLGFHATKEVEAFNKVIEIREKNANLAKEIAYYREKYPMYKFITEDAVREICRKYGLIYGKVSQYVGFVPENKLMQMEQFSIDPADMINIKKISGASFFERPMSREDYRDWERRESALRMDEMSAPWIPRAMGEYITTDKEFLIAAPAKDFKVSLSQKVENFKIVNKPVPDPVVLAPVISGYLIVCAWGDEASDPLVVNENNN